MTASHALPPRLVTPASVVPALDDPGFPDLLDALAGFDELQSELESLSEQARTYRESRQDARERSERTLRTFPKNLQSLRRNPQWNRVRRALRAVTALPGRFLPSHGILAAAAPEVNAHHSLPFHLSF